MKNYILYFEAEGFNFLLMDIIRNFSIDYDFIEIIKNRRLKHYLGKDVIKNLLNNTIKLCSDDDRFHEFINSLDSISKESDMSFENVVRDLNPESFDGFLKSLKKIIDFYIFADYDMIKQDENKIKENQPKVYERLRQIQCLKSKARKIFNKAMLSKNDYLKQVIRKISKDYNVPEKHLFYYKESELNNFIKNQIPVSENEMQKRKIASIVMTENNKIHYFFANEALEIMEKLKTYIKSKDSFKGTTAYKNEKLIIGQVKILKIDFEILNEQVRSFLEEISGTNENIILVTGATSPEMIPIFNKVSAIVTDQGALNSHAAIISRELKIPCIVGTKHATKILKDGDKIEVDTSKGIVNIIKH